MSEIQIDHEAAKSLAENQVKFLPCGWKSVNLARAYLDMVAQRDAERERVDELTVALSNAIGLLDGCILDCSQEDISRLTAIMEGRNNG